MRFWLHYQFIDGVSLFLMAAHYDMDERSKPPSNSTTFPTTSTNLPTSNCESAFTINVTSPLLPQVMVAVSPRSAEIVPSSRTVFRGKAWRWFGRTRGVWRDIASVFFFGFGSVLVLGGCGRGCDVVDRTGVTGQDRLGYC